MGPNFTPDGQTIIFASDRLSSDNSLDIFIMDADDANLTRLLSGITLGRKRGARICRQDNHGDRLPQDGVRLQTLDIVENGPGRSGGRARPEGKVAGPDLSQFASQRTTVRIR